MTGFFNLNTDGRQASDFKTLKILNLFISLILLSTNLQAQFSKMVG